MSETNVHPLRANRCRLNLTQKRLAEETGVGAQTILRAEHNKPINAESRRLLCEYFGMTSEELGLVSAPQEPCAVTDKPSEQVKATTSAAPLSDLSQIIAQGIILAARELESPDMDTSRRNFLQMLGITSTALVKPTQDFLDAPLLECLVRALEKRSGADELTLLHLEAVARDCWRVFPHMLGTFSRSLLQYVLERLNLITILLERSYYSNAHGRLATIAGDLAQVAGEILFDLKRNEESEQYYAVALAAARAAQNDAMQAAILGRKCFIPIYEHDAQRAVPFLQQARTLTEHNASDVTRAWLAAIEAETYAHLSDEAACFAALARAECFLARGQQTERNYTNFNYSTLLGYKGTCYLKLRRSQSAQEVLTSSLDAMGSQRIRHRSIVLVDLATAYCQQGEIEEACKYVCQALYLVSQKQSMRVLQRILSFRQHLEAWKDLPVVKSLDEQIEILFPLMRLNNRVHVADL